MGKSPTVVPASDFNAEQDAKTLKEAFKGAGLFGSGSDEKAIIDTITKRTYAQRLQIANRYKAMYGKVLIKELKSKLRGNFEQIIVALMTSPIDFQAKELHRAVSGPGTKESTLTEILIIHDNEDIKHIRETYEELYQTSLEKDIKEDTSGDLKHLLVSLVTASRDGSERTDQQQAFKDARALLRAGELIRGTDESTFNQILTQRNYSQLKLTFEEYKKITGNDFEEAIKNEFSGDIRDSLLALVNCIRNKLDYLAARLERSMRSYGTDDTTLIRIIVSRSEVDLGEIKHIFQCKFKKSLAAYIEEDTSGAYRKCLLSLIGT